MGVSTATMQLGAKMLQQWYIMNGLQIRKSESFRADVCQHRKLLEIYFMIVLHKK